MRCVGWLLLVDRVPHEARPQDDRLARDGPDAEPSERPHGHERAQALERAPSAERRQRVRVDVAAALGHVGVGEPVHVRAPLRQDPPELLVVALSLGLLVRVLRVAVEHAAAPGARLQAAALDALEVVELHAPVEQERVEGGRCYR